MAKVSQTTYMLPVWPVALVLPRIDDATVSYSPLEYSNVHEYKLYDDSILLKRWAFSQYHPNCSLIKRINQKKSENLDILSIQ
jgi:hypothetical protein